MRTLVILRWLAILGQTGAVFAAVHYLELAIPFQACLIVIAAAVLFNISATLILPANKRLSEREAMLSLLFDLAQLILLLYLTGGLHNPFSMLILAPVTIAATALTFNATLVISATALVTITLLTFIYTPLARQTGEILEVQNIFLGGMWFALTIGILFLASYARRVTVEMFSMSQALSATQMALAREHKLTALGGVVAAAAHEMGTPLATIKLVSSELASELKDDADLHDDAILIKEQADRLSQILRDMGRSGKDDLLLKHAPLTAILHEAAEPHEGRGKMIHFSINGVDETIFTENVPIISRHPEIIHGLRNLVQNAVDFSRKNVWVDARWDDTSVRVIVADDGNGYPIDLLDRIGDPFISKRSRFNQRAQDFSEYQGMGLGLFIAKTLLERSGAELTFANAGPFEQSEISGAKIKGAIVNVRWKRSELEKDPADVRGALGLNQQFDTTA